MIKQSYSKVLVTKPLAIEENTVMTTYEQLETAIYFLKVPELKSLVAQAGLKASTSKQALINDLLAFAKGEINDHAIDKPKKSMRELARMGASYDPKTHIVPGVYTINFR